MIIKKKRGMNIGVVYKIANRINEKLYIGITTRSIEARWKQHLAHIDYLDYHLYRAMRLYGTDNFYIVQIESVDDLKLLDREMYWIDFYDSFTNGYNMTRGGSGNRIYDKTRIYSLWDEGFSVGQISDMINSVKSVVYEVLLDYDKYTVEESLRRRSKINQKAVCQFDLNGMLINTFASETEACDYINASTGSIGMVCNYPDKHRTVKGYIWTWEDEKSSVSDRIKCINASRRSTKFMQMVAQLNDMGQVIAVYPNAKTAAISLGREKDSHIGDCCKGRRDHCYGYKWKFYSDIK